MNKLGAFLVLVITFTFLTFLSCKGASSPSTGGDAAAFDKDAAVQMVNQGADVAAGTCSLIQGVESGGVVRTICATVQEVADIIAFVLTLRMANDAGTLDAGSDCQPLPSADFCATSQEKAKAILFLVRARMARYALDAGH